MLKIEKHENTCHYVSFVSIFSTFFRIYVHQLVLHYHSYAFVSLFSHGRQRKHAKSGSNGCPHTMPWLASCLPACPAPISCLWSEYTTGRRTKNIAGTSENVLAKNKCLQHCLYWNAAVYSDHQSSTETGSSAFLAGPIFCFHRDLPVAFWVGTRPLAFWTTAAIFSGERIYEPSSSNFANV